MQERSSKWSIATRELEKRTKHKKAIQIKISLYNLRLFSIELPIEHNIEAASNFWCWFFEQIFVYVCFLGTFYLPLGKEFIFFLDLLVVGILRCVLRVSDLYQI